MHTGTSTQNVYFHIVNKSENKLPGLASCDAGYIEGVCIVSIHMFKQVGSPTIP